MFIVPEFEECIDFAKKIGCSKLIQVPIEPREFDLPYRCHDNCLYNPVLGYYFVKDYDTEILYAYKHSVLLTDKGLIDVTPTFDNRTYNIFGYDKNLIYSEECLTYLDNCVFINKDKHKEQDMYYVYGLIDPRTNDIFYIGKGKGNRWQAHYSEKEIKQTENNLKTKKIIELKELGYNPTVIFFAQNIEEENIAYDIEASLIKSYGRLNYEENGTLTNITIDSRPPNWKNKTYEEIYGVERGKEIKIRKAKQQKDRGGYFKGHKHTEESKKKISENSLLQAYTEEEILEYGKLFCEFFDNIINVKKWIWWATNNKAPAYCLRYANRFEGKNALEVFSEKFGAQIKMSPLLWFHHPETKETFRCCDWELKLNIVKLPDGFIKGRGISTFNKIKKHKLLHM